MGNVNWEVRRRRLAEYHARRGMRDRSFAQPVGVVEYRLTREAYLTALDDLATAWGCGLTGGDTTGHERAISLLPWRAKQCASIS